MTTRRRNPFGDVAEYAASSDELPFADQLKNKFAVVTGSTQGMGLAAAELMLRRGIAGVVISGRNAERGEVAMARLNAGSRRVVFHRTELENLDDCKSLIDRAVREFGSIDILVNSAGITDRGGVLDADAELWRRIFDINARAPFFLMQGAARQMIAQGRPGSIVNVASIVAHGGPPNLTIYGASKAALVAMTKNAAFSLAREGIRSQRADDRLDKHAIREPDAAQISREERWMAG